MSTSTASKIVNLDTTNNTSTPTKTTTASKSDTKENTTPKTTTPTDVKEKPKAYTRRTTEEIVAAYQKKIDYHTHCIAQLEAKKAAALTPNKNKQVKDAIKNAMAAGLTLEEITARLSN